MNPAAQKRGRRLSASVGIAAVIALVLFETWPRTWQVSRRDGTTCELTQGQSNLEVVAACGPADQTGDQPKVSDSTWSEWIRFCSAPCERRGKHLVFYDCDANVGRVEGFREHDYQGCILGD